MPRRSKKSSLYMRRQLTGNVRHLNAPRISGPRCTLMDTLLLHMTIGRNLPNHTT
jgi:hypothetical protein